VTTLLSWLSVDNRGPSAIYVVSDSRITWGSSERRWDSGRKVFAVSSPDIFGYCGEVLFPSLILSQLADLIGRGLLWSGDCSSIDRHLIVVGYLKSALARRHNAPNRDFTIVHCSRSGSGLDSDFNMWRLDYRAASNSWSDTAIEIAHSKNSKFLVAFGSGSDVLKKSIARWNATPQGETARALFSAFCDALDTGEDPLSGGMPQIVSLDRKTNGKVIGFVSQDTRYIHGVPVEASPTLANIEWVDRLFQRISPDTLQLLSGAQRHARVETPESGGIGRFFRRTIE
jgi:hypothetical protein